MSLVLLLLPQLVAFKDAGYEVVGVSAPGPYARQLEEHGIRHIALHASTRSHDPRSDVLAAREFLALCRRLRPDIVHTHNPKPGIYGRIAARVAGTPVVVNTVHGLYAQPSDPLRRRVLVYGVERVAATFSDAELIQNPEDLPILRRLHIPERKLHLLGNGVDLRRFDPAAHPEARQEVRRELRITDEEVVVGLVGRLVAEKGYREVFAAARFVRERHPNAVFVVTGPSDPDKPDAISGQELDAAAVAGVRLLGARGDVERLYRAMDIYVLASHREGFPRSAMEAAAMGLPVVATDIRGCRQVVEHGATGLLVPPRRPHELAEAISSLIADPERRATMGAEGFRKSRREFDGRRQISITLEVYENLQRARRRW